VTTFYLVRHAERTGDVNTLVGRAEGIGLTGAGRGYARQLGRYLKSEPIEHIFSSPLERARETAAELTAALGLEVKISGALTEIEYGEWTGRNFFELASAPRWRQFNCFRGGMRIPGGEMMIEVQTRIVGELVHLAEKFPDAAIALVSHGDPIRAAIGYFLGMPLDFYSRLDVTVGSVSILCLDKWGARLTRFNDRPLFPRGEA
jgi:broad specificity phosphatase PhoE